MSATYINDNSNICYPFYGMDELPFPLSYILGISIAILEVPDDNSIYKIKPPLYVSGINISGGGISVIICDSTDTLLCSIDSNGTKALYNKNLTYKGTDIIQVSLFLGDIPSSVKNSYVGKFYIDPSCITKVPLSVYGYHDTIICNKISYTLDDTLTIDTSGVIKVERNNLMYYVSTTPAADSLNLIDKTTIKDSNMVNSINGLNVRTGAIDKIAIVDITIAQELLNTSNNGYILTATNSKPDNDSDVFVLMLNGGKMFPNCYDKEKDDA